MIDTNQIPLVAFDESTGNCRIVVEAYRPGLDFTAISHMYYPPPPPRPSCVTLHHRD